MYSKQQQQHPRRTAAFSLVELVMVAAIIGIVATVSFPRFAQAAARQRADAAARRIVADIKYTRRLAQATSTALRLRFPVGFDSYVVERLADDDGWEAITDRTQPSHTYSIDLSLEPYAADVTTVAKAGDVCFTFDGFGQPGAAATVTLKVGDHKRVIKLAASGTITVIESVRSSQIETTPADLEQTLPGRSGGAISGGSLGG